MRHISFPRTYKLQYKRGIKSKTTGCELSVCHKRCWSSYARQIEAREKTAAWIPHLIFYRRACLWNWHSGRSRCFGINTDIFSETLTIRSRREQFAMCWRQHDLACKLYVKVYATQKRYPQSYLVGVTETNMVWKQFHPNPLPVVCSTGRDACATVHIPLKTTVWAQPFSAHPSLSEHVLNHARFFQLSSTVSHEK